MTNTQALRHSYRNNKACILSELQATGPSIQGIHDRLADLSRLADQLLRTLWDQAQLPDQWTLIAVGGFGREQLFPYSDVDVLILLPQGHTPELDPFQREQLECFIGHCWDSGLEIGSSVRTIAECMADAASDITFQTSLLESRLVHGNALLYQKFQTAYTKQLDPRAFLIAKTLEMSQRHTKYQNTPYSLEPNCKESPGGLRDLQMILWVARATGLGQSWQDLARNGIATEHEIHQIQRNEALLYLIRARLHIAAKRHEDRLVFDLQNTVAESFGYISHPGDNTKRPIRASERLMRRYYWAAKAVSQLRQILLLNMEDYLSPQPQVARPINDRFLDKAGLLEVRHDDLYERHPQAILETFLLFQQSPEIKDLSARTLRALYNARIVMDNQFRTDPINRHTFMQILKQPHGITHAMRLMNQTSVLGRYLRPFRRIVGQMQHDLFHAYTVDQHILMVLRNIRRFFLAEHAHEYPVCSQLAAGWNRPWVLYIAAIFHDIGKGRGGDHSTIGALEAKLFCEEHGVDQEDSQLIEFLVIEHLSMSRIAQKSDLSDPAVIQQFAKQVRDERHLTALYLLTVADIRGTSPKVWNAWKGKLLEDLYRATLRTLGGHAPDAQAEIETRKSTALALLAHHATTPVPHQPLWATLDVSYFIRHEASDVAWHTQNLAHLVGTAPASVVKARPSPVGEGLQVMVYALDKVDLFARICGYFDHTEFSIIDARVHTTNNGYALDTFQVVIGAPMTQYRDFIHSVEHGLGCAIAKHGPLAAPIQQRLSRRVKNFPIVPRVSLQPDEQAQRWLLGISASDRTGLLYSVARILAQHELSVQLAKISTLGERVEDTFLVQGQQLQINARQIQIETELLRELTTTSTS